MIPKNWKKNRTLPRSGTRVEEDMEHESEGYNDRYPTNNTYKVKKLVRGIRY